MNSVLDQTYEHLELIVVDDASTDETPDILQLWRDERIRYIRLDRRSGAPAARNVGIDVARGELVAFQDSDDEWLPEKMRKQVAKFRSVPESCAVVYTPLVKFIGGSRIRLPSTSDDRPRSGDLSRALARSNFISTQTAILRPDALRSVGGFDVSLPRFQDWDLWFRLSRSYLFEYVDEELVIAYDSEDSISRDDDAYEAALEAILTKHADLFASERAMLVKHRRQLARLAMRRGDRATAFRHIALAFAAAPAYVIRRGVLRGATRRWRL